MDPYGITPGVSYDVLSTGRGMVLVSRDKERRILNPLGLSQDTIARAFATDAADSHTLTAEQKALAKSIVGKMSEILKDKISFNDYQTADKIISKALNRLTGPPPKTDSELFWEKVNKKVTENLNSEPFLSERRRREADMAVFRKAVLYMDHLNHEWWEELPDWFRPSVAEPPTGCSDCKDSYDKWKNKTHAEDSEEALSRPELVQIGNKPYEEFSATWKPKDPTVLIQGKKHEIKEGVIQYE